MLTCVRGGHPSGTSCVICKTIAAERKLIGPGIYFCERCFENNPARHDAENWTFNREWSGIPPACAAHATSWSDDTN